MVAELQAILTFALTVGTAQIRSVFHVAAQSRAVFLNLFETVAQ